MAGATAHGARSVSIAAARCFSVVLIPPIFSASALSTILPRILYLLFISSHYFPRMLIPKSLSRRRKRTKDHERSRIGGRPSRHPTTAEARSGPLRSVAGQLPPTTHPRTARAGVVKPGDHIKTRSVPDSAVRRTGHSARRLAAQQQPEPSPLLATLRFLGADSSSSSSTLVRPLPARELARDGKPPAPIRFPSLPPAHSGPPPDRRGRADSGPFVLAER
jgi:hypothetical protein